MIEVEIQGKRYNFLMQVDKMVSGCWAMGSCPQYLILSQDVWDAVKTVLPPNKSATPFYPYKGGLSPSIMNLRVLIDPFEREYLEVR